MKGEKTLFRFWFKQTVKTPDIYETIRNLNSDGIFNDIKGILGVRMVLLYF